jgi:hypothetical protein
LALSFVSRSLPDVGGHQANLLLASLAFPTFIACGQKCAETAIAKIAEIAKNCRFKTLNNFQRSRAIHCGWLFYFPTTFSLEQLMGEEP